MGARIVEKSRSGNKKAGPGGWPGTPRLFAAQSPAELGENLAGLGPGLRGHPEEASDRPGPDDPDGGHGVRLDHPGLGQPVALVADRVHALAIDGEALIPVHLVRAPSMRTRSSGGSAADGSHSSELGVTGCQGSVPMPTEAQ